MWIEILLYFAPYVLCAAAGAYLEAKLGSKAASAASVALANAKAELAILKAKL